jgi:hypothetical protein
MRVRVAIQTPKRLVETGAWKLVTGTSRMPRNAFPIGSSYPVSFARNWHWRGDCLTGADDAKFRLLTAYNGRIEEFRGWLAVDFDKSSILLARYEFHGSHPGWHCHAPCDDLADGDLGALRTRGCFRFPGGSGFHRDDDFDITSKERALARAWKFFHVTTEEGDLL